LAFFTLGTFLEKIDPNMSIQPAFLAAAFSFLEFTDYDNGSAFSELFGMLYS